MTTTITPIRVGIALRPPRDTALDQAAIDLARKGQLQRQPSPIAACPERADDPHVTGARWRCCVLCGRVTPRVDRDWMPWCGGQVPKRPIPLTTPLRNARTVGTCRCGEPARLHTYGWTCPGCAITTTGSAA